MKKKWFQNTCDEVFQDNSKIINISNSRSSYYCLLSRNANSVSLFTMVSERLCSVDYLP